MADRTLIFLDRDGVLNANIEGGYVLSEQQFTWLPRSLEALRLLNQPENRICLITNQACVSKGLLSEELLHAIHAKMLRDIQAHGGRIDDIYYCPHLAEIECNCRKPRPNMIEQGKMKHRDIQNCWVVGDSLGDILAGKATSCRTILVESPRTRKELALDPLAIEIPDFFVPDLLEAVQIILSNGRSQHERIDSWLHVGNETGA